MILFLVRPCIVNVPGVEGCPEEVSYLYTPICVHEDDVLTLCSWEDLSIPSDHVLKSPVNG
jgi:hypothetical protein